MSGQPNGRAFLAEAAGPRMTVAVLGACGPELARQLVTAVGPTGLVLLVSSDAATTRYGVTIRAAPLQTPVLSHAADLVLIPRVDDTVDAGALVEEVRRLLAPRGAVRLLASAEQADRLASTLTAAGFKSIRPGQNGIAARGPR